MIVIIGVCCICFIIGVGLRASKKIMDRSRQFESESKRRRLVSEPRDRKTVKRKPKRKIQKVHKIKSNEDDEDEDNEEVEMITFKDNQNIRTGDVNNENVEQTQDKEDNDEHLDKDKETEDQDEKKNTDNDMSMTLRSLISEKKKKELFGIYLKSKLTCLAECEQMGLSDALIDELFTEFEEMEQQ